MTAGFTLASASETVLLNMLSVNLGVNRDFAFLGRIFCFSPLQRTVPFIQQQEHAAKGTNRRGIEGCSLCGLLPFFGQRQFKRFRRPCLLFLLSNALRQASIRAVI